MTDSTEPRDYEAQRDPSRPLRVRGIGRIADEPRALLINLTEIPTDDEIRNLHETLYRLYDDLAREGGR